MVGVREFKSKGEGLSLMSVNNVKSTGMKLSETFFKNKRLMVSSTIL